MFFSLSFTVSRHKTCYVELAHGGHLGFYEGGLIYPNPVTWLDRTLIAMVGALVMIHTDPTKQALISTS